MSWKVLLTARTLDVVGDSAIALLKSAGFELINPPRPGPLSAAELIPCLEGVDAVLASVDEFNAEVLNSPAASNLKVISRWGVGYDAIDVPAATKNGVVIAFTPGLLNDAVADYAFALLLSAARGVHLGHLNLKTGLWKPTFGHDVAGKTLGIIGCGRIGQAMARRGRGFDMELLGYDIAPNPEAQALGVTFVSLEELLKRSDYVSLHAALTPENRGFFGAAQLRAMKPTAFLINTARGALLDEEALVKALQEEWIAGAALDTYAVEPLSPDHPLINAPNLLLSPHHASFGRDTGEKISLSAAQAIVDLSQGQPPKLVVNPDVFKSSSLRATLKPS